MPTIWDAANLHCYNVIDGGAKGDGTTNDSAAIQALITTAAANATGGTVIFTAPASFYLVAGDVTCPANVSLVFFEGARVSVSYGFTLAINGPFSAGLVTCFSGLGTILIGAETCEGIYPQWWGALGNGSHDDTSAIQAAINATTVTVNASGRTTKVKIPRGEYVVSGLTSDTEAIMVEGDGMQNTILSLKSSANSVLFDFGGPASGQGSNSAYLSDVGLHGNKSTQSGSSSVVRLRRMDRTILERVYIQEGIGSNIEIDGSTVTLVDCQSYSSASHGLAIDASEVDIIRGFYNDNTGWGIYGTSTNANLTAPFPFQVGDGRVVVDSAHQEHNVAGEVYLSDLSHNVVTNNYFTPTDVTAVISCVGSSSRNVLSNNNFSFGGADSPTFQNGSASQRFVLSFGAQTRGSVYFGNSVYSSSGDPLLGTLFWYKQMVRDLGCNYCMEREDFQPRTFAGDGGHPLVGWLSSARTNSLLHSEDLTNASWVNGGSITSTLSGSTTAGNPLSSSGSATKCAYPAASVGPSTITQTVTGLAIASGDKVTFSIFCAFPDWTTARAAADVHVRILDGSNNILADTDYRPVVGWTRVACSFVSTTTYTSLQVQVYKYVRNADYDFYYWGAMLNKGDVLPYFGTVATTVTTQPGLVASQARIGNGATAGPYTTITGITVVNGIVTAITGS